MAYNFRFTSSLTLKCEFYEANWSDIDGTVYTCLVENVKDFDGGRKKVDNAIGVHKEWKKNKEVEGIMINFAPNVEFFPSNLQNVFGNLKRIGIHNSSLTEIKKEDLIYFKNLQFLWLNYNKIKTIAHDTFEANKQLEVLNLDFNQISHIDAPTFDKLDKLTKLFIDENECNLNSAITKQEVKDLVKKIQNFECDSTKPKRQAKGDEF